MTKLLIVCFCVIAASKLFAQQSQIEMQQQKVAADVQQSASATAIYRTPLAAFQAYYAGLTANNAQATFACFTQKAMTKLFGATLPTVADYSAMDVADVQRETHQLGLNLFRFTAHASSPRITVVFSFSAKNPQDISHPLKISSKDDITFVDTAKGWMIDDFTEF